jgi:hypothetical protein
MSAANSLCVKVQVACRRRYHVSVAAQGATGLPVEGVVCKRLGVAGVSWPAAAIFLGRREWDSNPRGSRLAVFKTSTVAAWQCIDLHNSAYFPDSRPLYAATLCTHPHTLR